MSRSVFTFDSVPFDRRLAETIAWCAPRARNQDPRESLRSEELRPSFLERDRSSALQSVAGYRSHRFRELPAMTGNASLIGGRLLVYFPDADLADGAAEVQSLGLFDVHNVPPWDTWIALADDGADADVSYRQYVVTWIRTSSRARQQASRSIPRSASRGLRTQQYVRETS